MCCISDFSEAPQYYEDAGGVLDIVPASGFFLNAIVRVTAPPNNTEVIARNGGAPSEGWELLMRDATGETSPLPAVGFNFRVWDTSGLREVLVGPLNLVDLTGGLFDPYPSVYMRVAAVFFPPGSTLGSTFGAIRVSAEDIQGAATVPLLAAYVNTTPLFQMGFATGQAFEPPNCIHGVEGGDGITGEVAGGYTESAQAWKALVAPFNVGPTLISDSGSYQMEPMPDVLSAGITTTNGWRANNPVLPAGNAPDPWVPFVGAVSLLYANAPPPYLTVDCGQPSIFWTETRFQL